MTTHPISGSDAFSGDSAQRTAKTELNEQLSVLATKEQISAALKLEHPETLSEEFWEDAVRTVRHRFLLYCMQIIGKDLATDWPEFDYSDLELLGDVAKDCLDRPDFSYTTVRDWFRARGQYEYSQAIALRRERAHLADSCIRVLLVMEPAGAKYLAYDTVTGAPTLVSGPALAHRFPVNSVSQLEKGHLLRMAEHFEVLSTLFPVKEIKLLPGSANKSIG